MGHHDTAPMTQKHLRLRPSSTKTILGCCLLFLVVGITLDRSVHAAPQSSLSLSMHNQQFSAHIIRAPLEQVLHTISSYGPIQFVIKGNVEKDQISSSFRHLSLEETLEKILVKYDFAIIHHQVDVTQHTSEVPYRTEVVILSRNHSETISDSNENSLISPSKQSSPSESVLPITSLKSSDPLNAFDLGEEIKPRNILDEVEGTKDTDAESLALIKKLLAE